MILEGCPFFFSSWLENTPRLLGTTPKMEWRKIIIAGISGYACGKFYTVGKKHSDIVIPVIEGAVFAGVCGSLLGLGVAAYRKLPSHAYAISVGANFAITTGSFLGLRQWVIFHKSQFQSITLQPITTNQMSYLASAFSGGMTGSLLSLLSRRSLYSFLQTSFAGILTGLAAQYGYNIFEVWRKRKALEMMFPEVQNTDEKPNWSMKNFEKKWLEFWHRKSHAAAIEQDILLLQDLIKEEKEKLKWLNKELGLPEDTCDNEEHSTTNSNKTLPKLSQVD